MLAAREKAPPFPTESLPQTTTKTETEKKEIEIITTIPTRYICIITAPFKALNSLQSCQLPVKWQSNHCTLMMEYVLDDPLEEVDTDGLLVVPREEALAEALNHARLAHSTVAHDHHLNTTNPSRQNQMIRSVS